MWLSVEDCAQALMRVWAWGEDGVCYTVPGNEERSVRYVIHEIYRSYTEQTGHSVLDPEWGCERPGGDRAYRVDGELIRRLGWAPQGRFTDDLPQIVAAELAEGVRI
jgi:dTDP-D-glucose 4,6-dehydratase